MKKGRALLLTTTGLVTAYVGANTAVYLRSKRRGESGTVLKPPSRVSVIMPCLYEPPEQVKASILSLYHSNVVQAYPSFFEFILVGDPQGDGHLKPLEIHSDRIIGAPFGKLNARHEGILCSAGEIIVAVDGDARYPKNWLNEVLKPFHDPGVVAVQTPFTLSELWEPFYHIPKNIWAGGRLLGGGSAFRKKAYFQSGGFNLTVDQFDWDELMLEEEQRFMKKMKAIGRVVFVNVPHYMPTRPHTPERIRAMMKKGILQVKIYKAPHSAGAVTAPNLFLHEG